MPGVDPVHDLAGLDLLLQQGAAALDALQGRGGQFHLLAVAGDAHQLLDGQAGSRPERWPSSSLLAEVPEVGFTRPKMMPISASTCPAGKGGVDFAQPRRRPDSSAACAGQPDPGEAHGKQSTDHRHHRPGRLLPGRLCWTRATRSTAWCAAPAPRPSSASTTSRTGSSFLQADLLDQASLIKALEEAAARRDLQPGRPVLRAHQLEPAGAHRASSPAWA